MKGKKVKITRPIDAMRHGIAYLPEDRKVDGIVGDLSVRENIILAQQVLRGFFKPFSKAEANKIAEEYIKLLDIKTASADTPILSLSGGNQQKCVIGKGVLTDPKILLMDEPSRGIDIGAKTEVFDIINQYADRGLSIICVSSELKEMLAIANRVVVLSNGIKTAEFTDDEITEDNLVLASYKGHH